jgi:uncharacterized protein (DUF849 family)
MYTRVSNQLSFIITGVEFDVFCLRVFYPSFQRKQEESRIQELLAGYDRKVGGMMSQIDEIPTYKRFRQAGEETDFADAIAFASEMQWDIPYVVVLKLASIGGIYTRTMNPYQPRVFADNLRTVMECIEAGVCGVHFNPTDEEGRDVGGVEAYQALIHPCRERYGYRFVADSGLITGNTVEEQLASVLGGLVETAPVPPGRPRQWVEKVAALMEERNCRPEICVHTLGEIELAYRLLIKSEIVRKPYAWQILVNVPSIGPRMHDWMPHQRAMAETLLPMVNRIREIAVDSFILVCQSGRASIYLSTYAMLLGLHVRIGTEDTMWRYPHRSEVINSNRQVVRDHVALAELLGRRPATGDEYRTLIGLPSRETSAPAV